MAQVVHPARAKASGVFYDQDGDGVVHIRLARRARRALDRALRRQAYIEGDEAAAIARAMAAIAAVFGPFGVEILVQVAAGELGEGVAVFHDLPHERVDWSPYPGMPARSAKETCLSELLLLGIGGFMGEPYGVASEGDRLINELIPSRADIDRLTGNGSRRRLGLHYENAAPKYLASGRDYSPKALLLTGVSEQVEGGPTTPVAIAARAVARLSPEDQRILREPCAMIRVPERWRGEGAAAEVGPVPVVFGPPGREHVVAAFYGDLTRPLQPAAAEAVERLAEALDDVAIPLKVAPGLLVYLANGPVLHGRSDFLPELDDDGRARRWLLRVFLAGRVDELRGIHGPHQRVFDLARTARA